MKQWTCSIQEFSNAELNLSVRPKDSLKHVASIVHQNITSSSANTPPSANIPSSANTSPSANMVPGSPNSTVADTMAAPPAATKEVLTVNLKFSFNATTLPSKCLWKCLSLMVTLPGMILLQLLLPPWMIYLFMGLNTLSHLWPCNGLTFYLILL